MIYPPEMTLREARKIYFRLSGFGADGGYSDRWIKVKVWKLPIWLPNVDNRRRAVRLHDLHHILTEYPTTWRGEAEISAWEIGTGGLRRYWAGWILDLMNLAQGLVVNPRGVFRAFMRGRGNCNLFAIEFSEDLLENRVGDFREKLWLNESTPPPGIMDYAAFGFWMVVGVAMYVGSLLLAASPLIFIVFAILFR
jgi:hypothetical protein